MMARTHSVLPLVPEPIELVTQADLAQVDLLSDPAIAGSTKVSFAFKVIEGTRLIHHAKSFSGGAMWNVHLWDLTVPLEQHNTKWCSNSVAEQL